MKKIIFLIGTVFCTYQISGQVGINIEVPHPSSILTIAPINQKGQYKGSLISPMTTRQVNSIPNPAKGLMVYDTDLKCLKVNKGTPAIAQWVCIRTK